MTPEQEAILLDSVTKTRTKMDALVSDDLSRGMVPELQRDHSDFKLSTESRFSFYRGAIALLGFLLIAFGATVLIHLFGQLGEK